MTIIARPDHGSISVCPNQGHIWAHSQLVGKIRNYWLHWWAPTQFNSFIHSDDKEQMQWVSILQHYCDRIHSIVGQSIVCFFLFVEEWSFKGALGVAGIEMALHREKVNGIAYGHCIALGTKGTSCVRHWECNHVTQQLDISMTGMS